MNRRTIVILLLFAFVAATAGCRSTRTSSGATTGGMNYVTGAYQKSYPYTVRRTYEAVLDVLEVDKIPAYAKEAGATIASVSATLEDGTKMTVNMKATGASATAVTIRIGAFGDADRSNYFFEQISQRLK